MKFLKTNELVGTVYNDGVVSLKEKIPAKDEYNTPIPGKYTYKDKTSSWYRNLGVTSQEDLDAKTFDKRITKKIGIPGNQETDSQWRAVIGERHFEIYRSYFNYKNDETELSLVEVDE